MKIQLPALPSPIIWQCLYHALADGQATPKPTTLYTFETPNGDVEITLRHSHDLYRIETKELPYGDSETQD